MRASVSQAAVIDFLRTDPLFARRIHHAAGRGATIYTPAGSTEAWSSLWTTRAIIRYAEQHAGAEPSVAKLLRAVALVADDSRQAAAKLTRDQYLDRHACGLA